MIIPNDKKQWECLPAIQKLLSGVLLPGNVVRYFKEAIDISIDREVLSEVGNSTLAEKYKFLKDSEEIRMLYVLIFILKKELADFQNINRYKSIRKKTTKEIEELIELIYRIESGKVFLSEVSFRFKKKGDLKSKSKILATSRARQLIITILHEALYNQRIDPKVITENIDKERKNGKKKNYKSDYDSLLHKYCKALEKFIESIHEKSELKDKKLPVSKTADYITELLQIAGAEMKEENRRSDKDKYVKISALAIPNTISFEIASERVRQWLNRK
jgi:hypothetical protein